MHLSGPKKDVVIAERAIEQMKATTDFSGHGSRVPTIGRSRRVNSLRIDPGVNSSPV